MNLPEQIGCFLITSVIIASVFSLNPALHAQTFEQSNCINQYIPLL